VVFIKLLSMKDMFCNEIKIVDEIDDLVNAFEKLKI
jgi:hypothetical protein